MNAWIVFDPALPALPAFVLLGILGFILFLKERPFRNQRYLRILAALIALLGVAGIFFQPSLLQKKDIVTIVLTPRYDAVQADSIIAAHDLAKVYTMPNSKAHGVAVPLPSYNSLSLATQEVDYILGEGLPSFALDLLDRQTFQFFPSDPPNGLTELFIPGRLYENRRASIEGTFVAKRPSKLVLEGPAGREDSVELNVGRNTFSMSVHPKVAGQLNCKLIEMDSTGELHTDVLPLNILPAERISILMLQYSPTFDGLYLKNYLGQNHDITIRTQLSRGIFKYEYLNAPQDRYDRLSLSSLKDLDLVVADTETLRSIITSEREALDKAIQSGLGLLLVFNQSPLEFSNRESYLPFTMLKSSRDTAHLFLNGRDKVVIPVFDVKIEKQGHLNPVIEHHGNVLAGYVNNNFGRIGYSIVKETYPLILSGDTLVYGKLWSSLIEQTARRKNKAFDVTIRSAFPYSVNHPVDLQVKTTGSRPEVYCNTTRLPLKEDFSADNVWYTTFWPDNSGWQHILIKNDSSVHPFYVNGETEYPYLRAKQKFYHTSARASEKVGEKKQAVALKPIDPVYFFLMFLIGVGYLWLWPKLGSFF